MNDIDFNQKLDELWEEHQKALNLPYLSKEQLDALENVRKNMNELMKNRKAKK